MVWERLKYGLSLLPHFYSWRGTVMRQKFYHNVNYWFGCPKKCMSGGSQVVATALKAATGVLCGVEFSRNLGQKCGCDREDLWLKVSHPSATYYDSLCRTRVCKKEKGNKGTKRKINLFSLIHIFPNVIPYPFQKNIFSAPSSSLWNFKAIQALLSHLLLLSCFPSSQALAIKQVWAHLYCRHWQRRTAALSIPSFCPSPGLQPLPEPISLLTASQGFEWLIPDFGPKYTRDTMKGAAFCLFSVPPIKQEALQYSAAAQICSLQTPARCS